MIHWLLHLRHLSHSLPSIPNALRLRRTENVADWRLASSLAGWVAGLRSRGQVPRYLPLLSRCDDASRRACVRAWLHRIWIECAEREPAVACRGRESFARCESESPVRVSETQSGRACVWVRCASDQVRCMIKVKGEPDTNSFFSLLFSILLFYNLNIRTSSCPPIGNAIPSTNEERSSPDAISVASSRPFQLPRPFSFIRPPLSLLPTILPAATCLLDRD